MSMKDRKEIVKIISNMLDNPDSYGIYPTATAYGKLEMYVTQERMQALGWMYAEACNALDRGEDVRLMDVSEILGRMHTDFKEEEGT